MLSKKEEKQFANLIGKVDNPHKGLPGPVFEALCRVVPFAACEMVFVNAKKEI
jgi:hypothetical protein